MTDKAVGRNSLSCVRIEQDARITNERQEIDADRGMEETQGDMAETMKSGSKPGPSGQQRPDPYSALSPKGKMEAQRFQDKINKRKRRRISLKGYVHGVETNIIINRKGKYDDIITTDNGDKISRRSRAM